MSQVNIIEMFIILGFVVSLILTTKKSVLDGLPKGISDFLNIYGLWCIEVYLLTKIFTNLWN